MDVAHLFTQYGQPGLFLGGAVVLFRFILTRHDQLAKANLEELKAQVRSMTRRALRAELLVRAYQRAGLYAPEDSLRTELKLAEDVQDLFPEFDPINKEPGA